VSVALLWLLCLLLLPLIVGSALCSCAETTLFGLTGSDREWLARERPVLSRRVERLLAEPRALLLTVLLGNMTVNTLYFVVSSGIAMQLEHGVWAELAIAVVTLLLLVLVGETLPKLVGNIARRALLPWVAPPVSLLHGATAPIRHVLEGPVLAPLVRLAGPAAAGEVQAHELAELLAQSQQQGVLAAEEGEAIRRVTRLGARRVKEVMTPRVFLAWIRTDATRREIAAEAQRTRRRRLVVAEPDLDSVSGFLDVRSYLLDARGDRTPLNDHIQPAGFIPELATIGQLLGWFERSGQRVAVVVDEFGGTAGMVTLRDAVGEIGGREADAPSEAWVRQVGGGWTAPGDADLGEAFERLGEPEPASGADTVAGAIMERLDRVARVGDEVQWGGWRVRVLAMSGTRIDRVQWMPAGEGQGGA